jgi:hypothetical protein
MRPLPSSDSEYWEDAHVEIVDRKNIPSRQKDCEHYFVKHLNTVQCRHCDMGFFVNGDDEINEGHLYKDGTLIV